MKAAECIRVDVLVVILYSGFAKYYHLGKLYYQKEGTWNFCIVS